MNTLQLRLAINNQQTIKRTWAFAAKRYQRGQDKRRKGNRRSSRASQAVITSASPLARELGVRVGMALEDARLLLPELRVLVYTRR